MRKRSIIRNVSAAALPWLLVAAPCAAQPAPSNERTTSGESDRGALAVEVDAFMRAAVRNDQFSGAILIARDGVPLIDTAYGMASLELSVPNTPQTVFQIASVAKQFTAMAIMQLQERGKLNVGDSICKYLSDCPAAWAPITLRHLLTHTSGIRNYSSLPEWDEALGLKRYRYAEFVDLFRNLPLESAPGEKFKYSNSGYYLLGLIIERVSGEAYGRFLETNIFAPLGMSHSIYDDNRAIIRGAATGYYSRGTQFITAPYLDPTVKLGDSGIALTTGDLLRWDQALYTEKLVSRRSLDEIFTPYRNGYGYGWEIGEKLGRKTIGHGGSDTGFSSYILRVPNDRLTIIVLSNSNRTSAGRTAITLAAIALGEPYKLPKPQLRDVLWDTIAARGVAAGIEQYRMLHRSRTADYVFDEEPLLYLGYDLIDARRLADAEAILKLNIEMYPRAAYNYDGLGDIALDRGDAQAAKAQFERSLSLDPSNDYAIAALGRLAKAPAR